MQELSARLGVGDAGRNTLTAQEALERARRRARLAASLAARFALDQLLVAGSLLEGGEPRRRLALPLLRPDLHPPGRGEPGDAAEEPAEEEGAEPLAPLVVHVLDCRLRRVICTLGDLLLDVIVRLDGPIAEDTDTYGRTRVGVGGQAANVAAWVVALGGRARFLGKRARDPAGRILAEELRRRGVELAGPEVETGTGTVVSLAMPDGARTMLSDRGVSTELAAGRARAGLARRLRVAARPGLQHRTLAAPRDSFGRGSAGAAGQLRPLVHRCHRGVRRGRLSRDLDGLGPQTVFANEAEAELVGDLEAPTVVIKRGGRGCVVVTSEGSTELASSETAVVDTTGAGDAFAAGFLLGGPELALDAAARCVAKMGAMP